MGHNPEGEDSLHGVFLVFCSIKAVNMQTISMCNVTLITGVHSFICSTCYCVGFVFELLLEDEPAHLLATQYNYG